MIAFAEKCEVDRLVCKKNTHGNIFSEKPVNWGHGLAKRMKGNESQKAPLKVGPRC